MATFSVIITDPASLAGIAAARDAYNAALPAAAEPIATDAAYVQFVMERAAESYAQQYGGE